MSSLTNGVFIALIFIYLTILIILVNRIHYENLVRKRRLDLYNNYEKLGHIYNIVREYAYRKVFREEIFTYISSGYRLNSEEMSKVQKKYMDTVLDLLGPSIKEDLVLLHGDLYSVAYFLANDFFERIINDEVYTSNFTVEKKTGSPPSPKAPSTPPSVN